MKLAWIGLGGALGSIARYLMDGWFARRLGGAFPFGTLAVNLLGSFFLAGLLAVAARVDLVPPLARLALATGLLGGFTTYSTFNYDALRCFQDGAWGRGALYVGATVLGGLLAGSLGWTTGRALLGT